MNVLGIDLGKTSIGSSLIDTETFKILESGVRLFDAPETSKEQKSLHSIRGEKKRSRNTFYNFNTRRKKIAKLLIKYNLVNKNDLQSKDVVEYTKKNLPISKQKRELSFKVSYLLFRAEDSKSSANLILGLRNKALFEKLTCLEFARLLYSMNNHRGVSYEDTRSTKNIELKQEKIDELTKKVLKNTIKPKEELLLGLQRFKNEFKTTEKYITFGHFLYENYKEKFRNTDKGSLRDFLFVIPRIDISHELNVIFDKQFEFGNSFANLEFKNEYLEAFNWEKESPSYKDRVSFCEIDSKKQASSKQKIEAILYVALEKLHNLRFKEIGQKDYSKLSIDEIINALELFKSEKITFKALSKILDKNEIIFKGIDDNDKIFIDFTIYKRIAKILNLDENILDGYANSTDSNSLYNQVIEILAYNPSSSQKEKELEKLGITNEDNVDALLDISFKGNLSYCENVLRLICDGMLNGFIPHDAKELTKNSFESKRINKLHYLPPIMDTNFPFKDNHTVVRALSQLRLVVNNLLIKYRKEFNNPNWFFDRVVIELARDMNSKKSIENIKKDIDANTKANKEAIVFCEKYNIFTPTYAEILKAKLYLLQDGIELYPRKDIHTGEAIFDIINAELLFDDSYCEIDHTLPFSRSLDNSISNKTLVLSSTNQNKENKTPYEYLDTTLYSIFERNIEKVKHKIGTARARKLLNTTFDGIEGFKERDIIDTQIMSKYAGLYINNYLAFPKDEKIKRRVYGNNGKITSILRKSWAIGSKNRNTHIHHAEDAILIAFSTPLLIKNIATFINIQNQLESFDFSVNSFDKLFKNEKNLKEFIIRNLKEKENIDIYNLDNNVTKKEITSKIFKIIALKCYPSEDFNKTFINAIKDTKVTHFVKEKTNGSIHKETINSLKKEKSNDESVLVRGGFAENGEFLRYDVFLNTKGKYEFIKLTAKHHGKNLNDLPTPKDSKFLFSVYKNTLLEIIKSDKKELILIKGIFRKIDSSLYIDSTDSTENEIFRYKLDKLSSDYFFSDDLNNTFEKKDIIKLITLASFAKKSVINTKIIEISRMINEFNTFLQKNDEKIELKCSFGKTSSIETYELKKALLENKIIENEININASIKTVYIKINESSFISPFTTIGINSIRKLKKIQIDSLGNESTIEYENRKILI